MEAVLHLAAIAAALALSLASGVALAGAGLEGLFRLLPGAGSASAVRRGTEWTFAGGALPRAPVALSPRPAGSVSSLRARRFSAGRRR